MQFKNQLFNSDKGPIDKRQGEAVHLLRLGRKHLPHHGLLVRDVAPHCRHADAAGQVSQPLQIYLSATHRPTIIMIMLMIMIMMPSSQLIYLLHDLRKLRGQCLAPAIVEYLIQSDILQRNQSRLQHIEPCLVRKRENRHRLPTTKHQLRTFQRMPGFPN